MRFGANYTPPKGWFHHWLDLDLGAVRDDFDRLAALGLDHVRVFTLWPLLQPHRGLIRTSAIDDLAKVVDTAARAGLDVAVDVLQGHLSSFDFYPAWTQTWHRRNIFTDRDVVAAQAELLRTVAGALKDRPNLIGLTIGNEMNNLVEHNPVTAEEVDTWLDTLLAACHEGDPGHPHVHSAYDAVWYADGHPFTPRAAATKGAMTTVHPWVFSGDCARRYGPLAPQTTHLAEYVVELAKAYADDPDRPVWVQELGAPEPHVPARDAARFATASLRNALTCENVWGFTWWCSHDVDRRLKDFPELEYTLGLLANDGSAKPLAAAYAEIAAAEHTPVQRDTALAFDGTRSSAAPGGAFFEKWMRAAAEGGRPAIVLEAA
ncbi:cellulase family glycosylhydrolase [Nonomuraea africana]|uniref:Endo-1,4-beta-mannosidase n=1 Tax=Nonomuraea africana TaxID=46171 RepID=A0ABR9KAB9_9ACTN|nr:cellulase family glycosylhydrolase [Nonomuraea africana]MBE1558968.1 endo-1,4-beta-mannosidase [Nonomuraea africana]